jgi:hypothetical protein
MWACSPSGTVNETTTARTFSAPLDKPSHSGLRPPSRAISRAEKGRAGRKKGGRGGKRAGNTGQQRSLTVNNGHSKTGPDQGRSPLTRYDARISLGVRFPPAPRRPKWASTRAFGGGDNPTSRPPSRSRIPDQVLCGVTDGGVQPPSTQVVLTSLQLSDGGDKIWRSEGGKRADATMDRD